MNKPYLLLIIIFSISSYVKAQTQPFGKIDTADLKLTFCNFEKDANAEVLFDKAEVTTGFTSTTVLIHKRIKIFNDKGKDVANFSLLFYNRHGIEDISNIQAETINLENNIIEFDKVEKKMIYYETIDKSNKKVVFAFPHVKSGSVIECSYKLTIGYEGGFPDWIFQGDLPTRYSELSASIRKDYSYKMIPRVFQDYEKNTTAPWLKGEDTVGKTHIWALKNVPAFRDEPYSTSKKDNLERIDFFLSTIKFTLYGRPESLDKSWEQIGAEFINDENFGLQLKDNISDEGMVKKAKSLNTDDEKVNYIFTEIKNKIKWNGINRSITNDGIKMAWEKKSGNSTEINLILYQFLRQVGIKCYPLLISTRDHGKLNLGYPNARQFNKAVICITDNKRTTYVLDACEKNNIYTNVPFDILNSNGLLIDPVRYVYVLMFLKNDFPSREVVFVNAQIKPEGRLEGTAQINSFNYKKTDKLNLYDKFGETKYIEELKNYDNNLKINSFKRENAEIDTLPLTENIDFKFDLTGSDDTYIYINPNLFTSFYINPLISEYRNSSIDFGYLNYYAISGRFKIPVGYKIAALPQNLSLIMPDKSINFKRIVTEQDGEVLVHYIIDYKKSTFTADEYPSIHDFYKKMYEMLNEQIVLKKI